MPVAVVFSTFPNPDKAAEVARILVGEGLAACVNLLPAVRSIYRWKGDLQDDTETLAIIKTADAEALIPRLVALHPYEVPEAITLPIASGHPAYLEWVTGSRSGTT